MKKFDIRRFLKAFRPWAIYGAVFLVLRFTGIPAGVSTVAQTALMKTGVMDAEAEVSVKDKSFNYDFMLQDLLGKKVDVNQFKGKAIFLNLWATWCGPCRVEMPSIQKLYDKVDHDKIVFILLSIDQPGATSKVVNFINEKKFTFPVYMPASSLPQQLQVPSIPTTFVISPSGKIVSKEVGTANYDTEEFKAFLEGISVN